MRKENIQGQWTINEKEEMTILCIYDYSTYWKPVAELHSFGHLFLTILLLLRLPNQWHTQYFSMGGLSDVTSSWRKDTTSQLQ